MRRGSWLGVLLVLAGVTTPALGQGIWLEWKLKKDDTFFVESKIVLDKKLEALGKEAKQKTERTTWLRFKVLDKTDQATVLEEQIESMDLKVRDEIPLNRFSESLKASRYKITLNPKMEVTRFEGYDEFIRKAAGETAENQGQTDPLVGVSGVGPFGFTAQAEARRTMMTLLSEDALRKGVEEIFAFVPGSPVQEGALWKRELKDTSGPLGQAGRTINYRYEGREMFQGRLLDKITFTGNVTLETDKPSAGSLPFQVVKASLKADDLRGTIYFDSVAGRMVSSETKLKLKGPMTLKIGEIQVEAKVEQDLIIRSELSEKGPAPLGPVPGPRP